MISQKKLVNGSPSKDKLLAHVMGKLVLANIDDIEIEDTFILEQVTKLMKELNDEFYENARKTPIDRFWQSFLDPRFNLKYGLVKDDESEANLMVDILTSLYLRPPKIVQ